MMRRTAIILFGSILAASRIGAVEPPVAQPSPSPPAASDAVALVERLRELPPTLVGQEPSGPEQAQQEAVRSRTYEELLANGPDGLAALADALSDHDTTMRQNAALALLVLGSGVMPRDGRRSPPAPIGTVLPKLVRALDDSDGRVRGYVAQSIGSLGPQAAEAVPELVRLLGRPDPASRNSACIALRRIGAPATAAIPALERAAADPDADLRRFAMLALEAIRGASTK